MADKRPNCTKPSPPEVGIVQSITIVNGFENELIIWIATMAVAMLPVDRSLSKSRTWPIGAGNPDLLGCKRQVAST
jgi:hypothetical protein